LATYLKFVIPAQAGIHWRSLQDERWIEERFLDSRLRWNDEEKVSLALSEMCCQSGVLCLKRIQFIGYKL
jgi:hypothetical protein